MKKALLSLLVVGIAFTTMQPSQAEDQKVLAIIDSAINSNNFPQIIHEVCFTTVKSTDPKQNMSCPNGELFMEGRGSAGITNWPTSGWSSNLFHGDAMVKSALTVNKDLKIVFIRVYNIAYNGSLLTPSDGSAILKALEWVNSNASKYSIDAVSVSQSGIKKTLVGVVQGPHYGCSDASIINPFKNQISMLSSLNIPTFIATGNDKQKYVGFPSCIPGAIAVGALANEKQLEAATNTGPELSLVALGKASITKYNGSPTETFGTSVATAVSAASYVSRNTFKTFGEYLESLPKILIGSVSYRRN